MRKVCLVTSISLWGGFEFTTATALTATFCIILFEVIEELQRALSGMDEHANILQARTWVLLVLSCHYWLQVALYPGSSIRWQRKKEHGIHCLHMHLIFLANLNNSTISIQLWSQNVYLTLYHPHIFWTVKEFFHVLSTILHPPASSRCTYYRIENSCSNLSWNHPSSLRVKHLVVTRSILTL